MIISASGANKLRWRATRSRTYQILIAIFLGAVLSVSTQIAGAPPAQANILGTAADTSSFGGGSGGSNYSGATCPANSVVVGVSTNGTGGVAVWCRALQADGTLPANDNTTSNSTRLGIWGSTSVNVFCPAGRAATILRIQSNGYANGSGLSCQTPPTFQDTPVLSPTVNGSGSFVNVSCPTGRVVVGAWAVTGAWIDRIGARCAPFNFLTVTYNVNGGSGTAPSTQTQAAIGGSVVVAGQGSVARTRYRFGGWNTLANGTGTTVAVGSSFTPTANTTLFAQWESTISYDGNTHSSGTAPSSTTAVSYTHLTLPTNREV